MAVGGVPGHRLDRVRDGVAEVEHLAQAAVALVGGDDAQLGPRAGGDDLRRGRVGAGADALPQAAPGDQRRLDHLGVAGGELGARQAGQRVGVADHGAGLVKGADVVLGLLEVDTGLAAVGRVDLGHQRRGDLHVAHAALIGGGTEAGQVADHPAAEGDDEVLAGEAGARQLRPHDLGVGDRLGALARHDHHLAAHRRHACRDTGARRGRR